MNIDIDRLKGVAKRARDYSGAWFFADGLPRDTFLANEAVYIAAASPDAVLELIAEVERLRGEMVDLENKLRGDADALPFMDDLGDAA